MPEPGTPMTTSTPFPELQSDRTIAACSEGEVSPLREHRLEAHRVCNPAGSPEARTPEGEEARFGVQHLGGRVAKRTGERRDPRSRRAHEADDRMAVTGTVGRERPSGLVRDDEGNHGGIGEGVVGESFELGYDERPGCTAQSTRLTRRRG